MRGAADTHPALHQGGLTTQLEEARAGGCVSPAGHVQDNARQARTADLQL